MRHKQVAFTALVLALCLILASCELLSFFKKEEPTTPEPSFEVTTPRGEETTPEVTTPEETTPEQTTPAVTEPDFSNEPDPDGTKRY